MFAQVQNHKPRFCWSRFPGALATVLLAFLVLQGCEATSRSFELSPGGEEVYIDEFDEGTRTEMRAQVIESLQYGRSLQKIRVGDVIEVIYHTQPGLTTDRYAINPGDLITLDFADDLGASVSQRVTPDGWITLPESGTVRASGLTVPELNDAVRERYSQVFLNPRVSARLEEWTLAEQRFLEDIESFALGRAREIPVTRDGRVTLPLLRPIQAAGLALPDLAQRINGAYAQLGLNLQASALFAQTSGDRIYVLGEVANPGLYVQDRPQTVLMTVAQAGGVEITGSLGDVRVFFLGSDGTPRLRRVNLLNVLTTLSLEEDMTLPDNSVVYVPPTGLATAGRTLDQVLRQILFFQGASIGFGYELNPQSTIGTGN